MRSRPPRVFAFWLLFAAIPAAGIARPRKPHPTPTPRPAPTAAPYRGGKPTRAQLELARSLVRPFLPWEDCYRAVVLHAGKPLLVVGDVSYWYAKDGDACVELSMENMAGNVGVVGLGEYARAERDKFARCER